MQYTHVQNKPESSNSIKLTNRMSTDRSNIGLTENTMAKEDTTAETLEGDHNGEAVQHQDSLRHQDLDQRLVSYARNPIVGQPTTLTRKGKRPTEGSKGNHIFKDDSVMQHQLDIKAF
jgi:hypothetical protein